MTTLLLSAGDASGDLHAAGLVRAIRARKPDIRFVGLGGSQMEKAGVELLADQKDLAVGGLLELAGSLGRLNHAWRQMGRAIADVAPDLVVLVDSGGFNLPFARRVRRQSDAQILYYVAPQVWAWRRGRIRKIASRVDRLAVIFPFEPEVYRDTGLHVDFVGHPLVSKMAELAAGLDQAEARDQLDLPGGRPLVVLLPGSRRNEIQYQLPIQLESARLLHGREPRVGFVLALPDSISFDQVDAVVRRARLPEGLRLSRVVGQTHQAIRAADVALAKPGTVTVEIMLLERPMVVMGRANFVTAQILRRAVKVPWLGMPNLIAGEQVVPELLQENATPNAIADALFDLLAGPGRERQLKELVALRAQLGGGGASENTCAIALEMLKRSR